MTAPALLANTDLVAAGFIKTLLGWTSNVGRELPGDNSWTTTGFVQVNPVGGSADQFVPMRHPVLSVKCWARNAGSSRRPPWGQASTIAEQIRNGCQRAYRSPVTVVLPSGYPAAFVHSAYLLTEPVPQFGDDSAFAVYRFDMQMHWTSGGAS